METHKLVIGILLFFLIGSIFLFGMWTSSLVETLAKKYSRRELFFANFWSKRKIENHFREEDHRLMKALRVRFRIFIFLVLSQGPLLLVYAEYLERKVGF